MPQGATVGTEQSPSTPRAADGTSTRSSSDSSTDKGSAWSRLKFVNALRTRPKKGDTGDQDESGDSKNSVYQKKFVRKLTKGSGHGEFVHLKDGRIAACDDDQNLRIWASMDASEHESFELQITFEHNKKHYYLDQISELVELRDGLLAVAGVARQRLTGIVYEGKPCIAFIKPPTDELQTLMAKRVETLLGISEIEDSIGDTYRGCFGSIKKTSTPTLGHDTAKDNQDAAIFEEQDLVKNLILLEHDESFATYSKLPAPGSQYFAEGNMLPLANGNLVTVRNQRAPRSPALGDSSGGTRAPDDQDQRFVEVWETGDVEDYTILKPVQKFKLSARGYLSSLLELPGGRLVTVGVVGRMVSNSEVIIDDQAESSVKKANQDAIMDAVITVWDEKICWDQTSGVNKGTSITFESIIPLVNNELRRKQEMMFSKGSKVRRLESCVLPKDKSDSDRLDSIRGNLKKAVEVDNSHAQLVHTTTIINGGKYIAWAQGRCVVVAAVPSPGEEVVEHRKTPIVLFKNDRMGHAMEDKEAVKNLVVLERGGEPMDSLIRLASVGGPEVCIWNLTAKMISSSPAAVRTIKKDPLDALEIHKTIVGASISLQCLIELRDGRLAFSDHHGPMYVWNATAELKLNEAAEKIQAVRRGAIVRSMSKRGANAQIEFLARGAIKRSLTKSQSQVKSKSKSRIIPKSNMKKIEEEPEKMEENKTFLLRLKGHTYSGGYDLTRITDGEKVTVADGAVSSMVELSDGRLASAGMSDGSIQVWDVRETTGVDHRDATYKLSQNIVAFENMNTPDDRWDSIVESKDGRISGTTSADSSGACITFNLKNLDMLYDNYVLIRGRELTQHDTGVSLKRFLKNEKNGGVKMIEHLLESATRILICEKNPPLQNAANLMFSVEEMIGDEDDEERKKYLLKCFARCVQTLAADKWLFQYIILNNGDDGIRETLEKSALFRSIIAVQFRQGPRAVFAFETTIFIIFMVIYLYRIYDQRSLNQQSFFGAVEVGCYVLLGIRCLSEVLSTWYWELQEENVENKHFAFSLSGILVGVFLVGFGLGLLTTAAFYAAIIIFVLLYPWVYYGVAIVAFLVSPHSNLGIAAQQLTPHNTYSKLRLALFVSADFGLEPWNHVDVGLLVTCGHSMMTGSEGDFMLASVVFLWLKLLGQLKTTYLSFATFVNMIEKIVVDIKDFTLVLGIFICMFTNVLYFRHATKHAPEFSLHDDLATHPYETGEAAFHSIFLLSILGDFDGAAFPERRDKIVLDMLVVVINVVMLNVLIAIVSDSYDAAIATSYSVFWRQRLSVVVEETIIFGALFKDKHADYATILQAAKHEIISGVHAKERKLGRIQDIASRVRRNTNNRIHELERNLERNFEYKLERAHMRTSSDIRRLEKKMDMILEGLKSSSNTKMGVGGAQAAPLGPLLRR